MWKLIGLKCYYVKFLKHEFMLKIYSRLICLKCVDELLIFKTILC